MTVERLQRWYSRRSVTSRRLFRYVFALLAMFGVLWFTPTPYYINAPGAAIDTGRLVAVEGGTVTSSRLDMLVIITQPANLFWYIYAKLDPRAELETREQFLGPIEDYEKYLELTRRMMADSKHAAPAVAQHQLGFGQGTIFLGAEITDLATGSPSAGYLLPGDVIVALEGRPVRRVSDLTGLIRHYPAGEPLMVRVKRGGTEIEMEVPTTESAVPERKGTAALGILIKDSVTFDIPIPVTIQSGPITGPSAGLMFTLQIIDQLTPGGITGGLVLAGTGTIEADGRVGTIGGVVQKVYTAEAAGADVMFVPPGNFADAARVATRVQVVQVGHITEALQWLRLNAR